MEQKFVSPILMWAVVLVGAVPAFLLLPDYYLLQRVKIGYAILFAAALNWLYFFFGALRVNRQAASSAEETAKLVTSGVYSRVRHPIYFADIVLAWGTFAAFPNLKVLLSVLWLTAILASWMRLEEAALEKKFGPQYKRYKAGVPMFLPRLF